MNEDTHFDNVAGSIEFNTGRYQGALRDVPDREEWITPAITVNAFYSPEHNSICECLHLSFAASCTGCLRK